MSIKTKTTSTALDRWLAQCSPQLTPLDTVMRNIGFRRAAGENFQLPQFDAKGNELPHLPLLPNEPLAERKESPQLQLLGLSSNRTQLTQGGGILNQGRAFDWSNLHFKILGGWQQETDDDGNLLDPQALPADMDLGIYTTSVNKLKRTPRAGDVVSDSGTTLTYEKVEYDPVADIMDIEASNHDENTGELYGRYKLVFTTGFQTENFSCVAQLEEPNPNQLPDKWTLTDRGRKAIEKMRGDMEQAWIKMLCANSGSTSSNISDLLTEDAVGDRLLIASPSCIGGLAEGFIADHALYVQPAVLLGLPCTEIGTAWGKVYLAPDNYCGQYCLCLLSDLVRVCYKPLEATLAPDGTSVAFSETSALVPLTSAFQNGYKN